MSNFSLTVNCFYGDGRKHIDKIIADSAEFSENELLKNFTKLFLKHYNMTKMSDLEMDHLRYHIKQAYNFFKLQKDGKSQIKTYNTDFVGQGQRGQVIEIFGKDAPFLLDSTLAEFKRLGVKVYKVIHPIIYTKRSNVGELLSCKDETDETDESDFNRESLIHIQFQKIDNNKEVVHVIARIKEIIESVYLSVDDWQKMIDAVHIYTNFFEQSAIIDPQNFERRDFLERLEKEYFVFLGAAKYAINPVDKNITLDDQSVLGILKKDTESFSKHILENIFTDMLFDKSKKNFIEIGKINKTSPVHRDAKLDYIGIKHFDEKLNLIGIHVFIGLFTSILYYQSAKLIPLIRSKVEFVLTKSGYSRNSYSGKEIISIIEALPRDELFSIKKQELASIAMEVSALLEQPALRLFIRESNCKTSLSILLFLPEVRFSGELSEKISLKLANDFGKIITLNYSQINDSKMGFYHIILDKTDLNIALTKEYCSKLEQELDKLTSTWRNKLKLNLLARLGMEEGYIFYDKFKKAFPASYKVDFTDNDFIYDDMCRVLESCDGSTNFTLRELKTESGRRIYLRVYSHKEYKLSDLISIIQNMGFKVNYEVVYEINPVGYGTIWLHSFVVEMQSEIEIAIETYRSRVEEALVAVWNNIVTDDPLNKLIITAKCNHRQVMVIKAIVKYLCQIGIGYSKDLISAVLIRHPDILMLIIELFFMMFDPDRVINTENNQEYCRRISSKINKKLALVTDSVEDKIIRACVEVVHNIVRTNYFVVDISGRHKDYLSFKINSEKMPGLPYPRPFREIFVYSTFFEGIHLRSSKVSRGGIRWSDRSEDFRTEILGLMKAQVAKNSVIVPMGSKGGFVIKRTEKMSDDEYYQLAIECYKKFLRGLLDITDNIVNAQIIHPMNVVRREDDDPYLVVAADKGTAKFSDFANSVSKEYNYWLGDAFASGGSAGYDHKKMGITAKGAWVSVDRHFAAIGINSQKDDFTVIAIGDMSGDVFGNGMLLSPHIKLLAAFNHMHIFIDPNPDSRKSFNERERLFNLARSTWVDYNPDILSKGAMIYNRSSKILSLTDEIKNLFELGVNEITPNELIKLILQMKVDLFWNGGIGTYVKAANESHLQVGDKANDDIRVNGNELRCRVLVEGGNLGLTQLGRIEFALNGGHINTDAIDNSAGVDCSDHEVNIKIAFHKALETQKITVKERDRLLEKMTDNVAELVLKDNYLQNLALTISEQQSCMNLSNYDRLIRLLEEQNILNRKLENLPSTHEIALRVSNKKGMTRPELSTLLAYIKNTICSKILSTNVPDDDYFYNDVIKYFPIEMQIKFESEIASHQLRREIIATSITNNMINCLPCYYLHLASEDTGLAFSDITIAYIIARDLFDMETLWTEVSKLDRKISLKVQVELFVEVMHFASRSTSWLIRNVDLASRSIGDHIKYFEPGIKELKSDIKKLFNGSVKQDYQSKNKYYIENNVPSELATKIAMLNALSSVCNIISVASESTQPVSKVAELFFEVSQRLNFEWVKSSLNKIDSQSDWQRLSIRVYKNEFVDLHRTLVCNIITNYGVGRDAIDAWFEDRDNNITRYNKLVDEIKQQEIFENSMVVLILQRLYGLLKK